MIHALKIKPEYFGAVTTGKKLFETRLNDRRFAVGDFLALNEHNGEAYTGRCCLVEIAYIQNEYVPDGYVTMSIKPCRIGTTEDRAVFAREDWYCVPVSSARPVGSNE